MSNAVEKLVERAVRACIERGDIAEVIEAALRRHRDELEGLRLAVGELSRLEQQNAERIRALERNEDRRDYAPAELLERLEAHLARLKAIG